MLQIAYIKQRRMSASSKNKGEKSTGGLSGLGAWPNKSKKDTDSAKVCFCFVFFVSPVPLVAFAGGASFCFSCLQIHARKNAFEGAAGGVVLALRFAHENRFEGGEGVGCVRCGAGC